MRFGLKGPSAAARRPARAPAPPRAKTLVLAALLAVLSAALSFCALIVEWRAYPRKAALALRADEAAALCSAAGVPLSEFLERARTAGAAAVLLPDRTWADLVAAGEASYFPRSQARALRAVGLLDPTASFPEDSLWVQDAEAAASMAGTLADAGLAFSTRSFSGSIVFSFPTPPDLSRRLAGPDPGLEAAVLTAGLLAVYAPRRWDEEAASIVRRAAARGSFPSAAYAAFSGADAAGLSAAAEAKDFYQGIFFEDTRPFGAGAPLAHADRAAPAAAVRLEGEEPIAPAVRRAVFTSWPRLLVLPLSGAPSVDAAVERIRGAAAGLRREGVAPTSAAADVFPVSWPVRLAWLRVPAAFLAVALLPWVCVRAAVLVLKRGLRGGRWPLASPVWQIAAGYAAACAAAVVGGLAVHGVLFPLQPGPLAGLLCVLPFALYCAAAASKSGGVDAKRLAQPLRVREGLALAAAPAAAWLLWGRDGGPFLEAPFLPWRAVLVGAPCLMAALWTLCRNEAGLRGLWHEERPLLFFALWLPLDIARSFYVSSEPFWLLARGAARVSFAGAIVGGALLAGLSYYELRVRPRRIRSRWI